MGEDDDWFVVEEVVDGIVDVLTHVGDVRVFAQLERLQIRANTI